MTEENSSQSTGTLGSKKEDEYEVPIESIADAVKEAIDFIDLKRKGLLVSLKTKWSKLNKVLGGGLEKGNQYIIAGRSGAGKSAMANLLIKSLFDENPSEKLMVLYFNFEMPKRQQIVRKLSSVLGLSFDRLTSTDLDEFEFKQVQEVGEKLAKYDIKFIDVPIDVAAIYKIISGYCKKYPDHTVINVFDHARLVTGDEDNEIRKLGKLSRTCMYLKKKYGCINVILSQLNRNAEGSEKRRAEGYKPLPSDIFGADSLYQDADVVLVPHRPEIWDLPKYEGMDTKDLLIMYVLKNRNGRTGKILCKHNLEIFQIDEV